MHWAKTHAAGNCAAVPDLASMWMMAKMHEGSAGWNMTIRRWIVIVRQVRETKMKMKTKKMKTRKIR